tara:strand:+ start:11316 stop:12221 length:906 start_codon:yes stop_codon:yes gene_type:complete
MITIERQFQTVWSDYVVKDETAYKTEIDLSLLTASSKAKDVALDFFDEYSGFDGTAYGEGTYATGLTEQQAYDNWLVTFNKQQFIVKKQLQQNPKLPNAYPQSVFDGLVLLNWATGKVFTVTAIEGIYDLLDGLRLKDFDTVASILMRSNKNKSLCIKCATILRLADYGKPKTRLWQRTNGIHKMRDKNEKDVLDTNLLKRARFSYFAETGNFLPFSPESANRNVVREYEKQVVVKNYTFDGTVTTFTLEKSPSMEPAEKLEVTINGLVQQHLFDFTVIGNQLSILKTMNTGDIIATTIKI